MSRLAIFRYGLLATLVSAIWGLNYVVVRAVLVNTTSLEVLTIRFLLLSVFIVPFFRKPPVPIRLLLGFVLVFTCLHLGCMYYALEHGLTASHSSVFVQIGLPTLMLLSAFLFGEKLTIWNLIGIFLSIFGVAYILNFHELNPDYILNYISITAAGIFWAFYSLLYKKVPAGTNYMALTAWIGLCSLPITWAAAVWVDQVSIVQSLQTVSIPTLLGILYMTFVSSLTGHSLWGYLLSKTSASFLAPFFILVPVFGVTGGIFFLQEPLTSRFLLGSVIVLVGLYFSIQKR